MPTPVPSSFPERSHFVSETFSAIATRYDLANHLLSAGLDFFWRRTAARQVASWKPTRILDLATGTGDLALTLRNACPAAVIVGADFCPPMLRVARAKGASHLVVADGLALPFADDIFDVVTVGFGLRNMASWVDALAEMRRVLRSGGHVLILDFSMPPPPLRWFYRLYLHHLLPGLAGLLTGERAAYDYLGASIEKFPGGPALCALLEGPFVEAVSEPMCGGIVTLYTATAPR